MEDVRVFRFSGEGDELDFLSHNRDQAILVAKHWTKLYGGDLDEEPEEDDLGTLLQRDASIPFGAVRLYVVRNTAFTDEPCAHCDGYLEDRFSQIIAGTSPNDIIAAYWQAWRVKSPAFLVPIDEIREIPFTPRVALPLEWDLPTFDPDVFPKYLEDPTQTKLF